MDRYFIFRTLLKFMENSTEVVDADMNNYCGNIEITCDDGEQLIKIEVSIKDKEGNKDAQELE